VDALTLDEISLLCKAWNKKNKPPLLDAHGQPADSSQAEDTTQLDISRMMGAGMAAARGKPRD
jgi:hypothetical protein